MSAKKKHADSGWHAKVYALKAGVFAESGFHEKAHEYARAAYHHAQAHRDHLAGQEQHKEVAKFNERINPILNHMESMLAKIPKPKKLRKADNASKMIYADPSMKRPINRNPGRDSRFMYKPFHELKPQEQIKARHAFGHSKDPMENYHYAFEPKSGQMVHGQRWLAPKPAPQASVGPKAQPTKPPQASIKPTSEGLILPQHNPGAAVVINSPMHEAHGKVGIVQHPNPAMAGKIRVQINDKVAKRPMDVFVHPHEVALRREIKKSEEAADNVVLLKSKAVLKRIKSHKGK